jgi:serine/threonine-protein kinase
VVTVFGHYELHELLGRGGMGEVYRAFDRRQDRFVALKLLAPSLAADATFVERFKRESRATAVLNDPHVIPIHTSGEIGGRLFIDMRLVEGSDLAEIIAREGPLAAERAVSIIQQAAEALDAAHARGLVHRDVKPSNLLVTRQDFVYLVDFGLVQSRNHASAVPLTALGQAIGTFAYMAPERMGTDQRVDGRADVYSLACVLYEALTGHRPYPAEDAVVLVGAHMQQPPPAVTAVRPDLPRHWDDVVAWGMAKNPEDRPPTAGVLAVAARDALRAAAEPTRHGPTTPTPEPPPRDDHQDTRLSPRRTPPSDPEPTTGPPPADRFGRRAWLIGAAALVVVLTVVAIVGFTGGWFRGTAADAESSASPTTTPRTTRPSTPRTTRPTTPPTTTRPAFVPDSQTAEVFPDLANGRATCRRFVPRPDQLATSDGRQPVYVAACTYAGAPGSTVYFHRWADVTAGPAWVEELRSQFARVPGLESARFTTNGVDQGAYVSVTGPEGPAKVQIFACYDRVPNCISITAPDLDRAQTAWRSWTSTAR